METARQLTNQDIRDKSKYVKIKHDVDITLQVVSAQISFPSPNHDHEQLVVDGVLEVPGFLSSDGKIPAHVSVKFVVPLTGSSIELLNGLLVAEIRRHLLEKEILRKVVKKDETANEDQVDQSV